MIFVDSGAWIAAAFRGDAHYESATMGWERLGRQSEPFLTTSLVVAEVASYLKRRAPEVAAETASDMLSSRELTIVRPDAEDELAALRLFRKYLDQRGISWVDCVSFAVMKRRRIQRVFGFDGDFDVAGFEYWPDPSFAPPRGRRAR